MSEPIDINHVDLPLKDNRLTLGALRDLVFATDDWPDTTPLLVDSDGLHVDRIHERE